MSERNQPIISGIEGTVIIHSDVDATTSAILLNNWTATVAPAVTDDSNAGYAIGSEWTDVTADKSYKLVDATVGAAVWKETTSAGGGSSVFTPTINGTNMVEVSQESDFGPGLPGGARILTSNTTYFVRGSVNITGRLIVDSPGISIKGWNRDEDSLNFTGLNTVGDLITVTDESFEMSNLKISSTNDTAGTVALRAINYDAAEYNSGRDKVLTLINCQFRNCFDVWYIEGFDLVDIQNTLVWYIEATTIGCQFKNVSKLQISSCEYVRWFDETLIGTADFNPALAYIAGAKVLEDGTFYESNAGSAAGPFNPAQWTAVGYSTASMIELLDNAGGPGFGAVNINGGIYHPQQTQNGIDISTSSTTGFGTISSNAFVDVGLTTGKVFKPTGLTFLPEYSLPATLTYDILANQGLLNSTSGVVATLSNNALVTAASLTPIAINAAGVSPQANVRFAFTLAGEITYVGKKQIYCSIHASVTIDSNGNTDAYNVSIWKDSGSGYVELLGSEVTAETDVGGSVTLQQTVIAINYGTLFNIGDKVELRISSDNPSNCIIPSYQLVIRE